MFLMPGLLVTLYTTGSIDVSRPLPSFCVPDLHVHLVPSACKSPRLTPSHLQNVLSPEHKTEMIRYLVNHQNSDGGYGLHIEGHSTMFGSCLSYVSMRILGCGPDHAAVASCRKWILVRARPLLPRAPLLSHVPCQVSAPLWHPPLACKRHRSLCSR